MTRTIFPTCHLVDLPEEVIRLIFAYLDDAVLYNKVRGVCHQLKVYVEHFVELGE